MLFSWILYTRETSHLVMGGTFLKEALAESGIIINIDFNRSIGHKPDFKRVEDDEGRGFPLLYIVLNRL